MMALIGFVLFTGELWAAGGVRAQLLHAGDLSAIQSKIEAVQIPGRTGPLDIEKTQAFAISGEGFQSFWMVPVHFEVVNQDGYTVPQPRCGMFVITQSSQVQFIPYPWSSVLRCNRLKGVGLVQNNAGAPPRILLLYAAWVSPDIAVREPVVLDWQPASAGYLANEALSQRLEDDGRVTDIASMKRQLKSY